MGCSAKNVKVGASQPKEGGESRKSWVEKWRPPKYPSEDTWEDKMWRAVQWGVSHEKNEVLIILQFGQTLKVMC